MLHVTGDRWHVTHDTRQVTHDMWQTKFFCKKNKQFLNLNGISATNDTRQEICCHPYVPYVSIQFLQYFEQNKSSSLAHRKPSLAPRKCSLANKIFFLAPRKHLNNNVRQQVNAPWAHCTKGTTPGIQETLPGNQKMIPIIRIILTGDQESLLGTQEILQGT